MSKGVSESEMKTEKFQNSVKTKTGKILQYFKDMYTDEGVFMPLILTSLKQGGSSEEDATESDTSPPSKKSKSSASSSSEELMNKNNGWTPLRKSIFFNLLVRIA